MSTTENGTKARYATILNSIRREASKVRDSNEKLRDMIGQLATADHPAPAQILSEATTTIAVGLEHVLSVFREF